MKIHLITRPSAHRGWPIFILLIAAIAVAYFSSLGLDTAFIWDDFESILERPELDSISGALQSAYQQNRPGWNVWLYLMNQWTHQSRPWIQIVSYILHFIATLALGGVLLRSMTSRDFGISWTVVFLFTLNFLLNAANVEAHSYSYAQSDLLLGMLAAISLFAFNFIQQSLWSRSIHVWLFIAPLCLIAATLKESGVVLGWALWLLSRSKPRLSEQFLRISLLSTCLGLALFAYLPHLHEGEIGFEVFPPLHFAGTQLLLLGNHLFHFLIPYAESFSFFQEHSRWLNSGWALPLGIIYCLILVSVFYFSIVKRNWIASIFAGYFLFILPSNGLLPRQDWFSYRLLYPGNIFLTLGLATIAARLGRKKFFHPVFLLLAIAGISGHWIKSHEVRGQFQSIQNLAEYNIENAPTSALPHLVLASELKDPDEQLRHLDLARSKQPNHYRTVLTLCDASLQLQWVEESLRTCRLASERRPHLGFVRLRWVRALLLSGQTEQAGAELRGILRDDQDEREELLKEVESSELRELLPTTPSPQESRHRPPKSFRGFARTDVPQT